MTYMIEVEFDSYTWTEHEFEGTAEEALQKVLERISVHKGQAINIDRISIERLVEVEIPV